MKKIIALICAFLLLGCLNSIIANAAVNEGLQFDLDALGLLSGVEFQDREGDWFTRGEFCRIITNMMDISADDMDWRRGERFTDVAGSSYAGSINMLSSMGIISGDGGTKFNPDDKIRFNEALKILVNILGYNVISEDNSLSAFYASAVKIGLVRRIADPSEHLNTEVLFVLLDNALDIPVLHASVLAADKKGSYMTGKTYRDLLMNKGDIDIQKFGGTVTADSSTYLNIKIPNLKYNQLEIEGRIYDFEGVAPVDLVGVSIEFYQRINRKGSGEVYAWRLTDDNTITEFKSRDIDEVVNNVLKLENQESVYFNKVTKYLYNGRIDTGWDVDRIASIEDASFRVIDNNNDGSADVVFIEEYVNCVVERTYPEERIIYFKNGMQYKNKKYISLDVEDDTYYIRLLDTDGQYIEFDEILADMVISLAVSSDGEAIKAVLSSKTIEGKLTEISEDKLIIDGKEYDYDMNKSAFNLGEMTKLYLNFEDVVVYSDKKSSKNYGYVYGLDTGSAISSNGKVKLLLPGPVAVKYIENEDLSGGEPTKTPKLFARNDSVAVYELASKVRVNNKVCLPDEISEAILNRAVRYDLNAEGKINTFEYLEQVGTVNAKYYNANELTFGKTDASGFGITQNITRAICVPTNSNASDDDLNVFIELLHNVRYAVNGYEVDETTHIADIILINSEMKAGIPGIVEPSSTIAIVERVSTVLQDGDVRIKADLIHDNENHMYYVSTNIPNQDSFTSLRRGDLIVFSLDGFDRLNNFELLQGIDNYRDYIENEHTENEKFCGIVNDIAYNYVSAVKNRWVNRYTLGYTGSTDTVAEYEAFVRGSAPVFVIEKNGNVRMGSYDDILIGSCVFFLVSTDNVRAVTIKI